MKWLRSWLFDRLNKRFFFGWVILAATSFSMIGTGPGQSHLIGLYFDPIGREMTSFFAIDWMQSNPQTALAYAYGIAPSLPLFCSRRWENFWTAMVPPPCYRLFLAAWA